MGAALFPLVLQVRQMALFGSRTGLFRCLDRKLSLAPCQDSTAQLADWLAGGIDHLCKFG